MTDGELARVLDDHLAAEVQHLDLDATMATMTADPYLNHVPVMTGGIGRDEVREFYGGFFIGHWPAGTPPEQGSRTVGADHVVDELVMSFTHDMVMNAVLPGVPPTGRRVRLAVCVVAGSPTASSPMSTSTGTRPRCWSRSGCWTRRACQCSARSRPRSCSHPAPSLPTPCWVKPGRTARSRVSRPAAR